MGIYRVCILTIDIPENSMTFENPFLRMFLFICWSQTVFFLWLEIMKAMFCAEYSFEIYSVVCLTHCMHCSINLTYKIYIINVHTVKMAGEFFMVYYLQCQFISQFYFVSLDSVRWNAKALQSEFPIEMPYKRHNSKHYSKFPTFSKIQDEMALQDEN